MIEFLTPRQTNELATIRNHFEIDPAFETRLAFPCCVCLHRHGSDRDEPCDKCEHNLNAEAA